MDRSPPRSYGPPPATLEPTDATSPPVLAALAAALLLGFVAPGPRAHGAEPLTVFANASLIDAMHTLGQAPVSYAFAVTRRAAGGLRARAFLVLLAGLKAEPSWRRFGLALPR